MKKILILAAFAIGLLISAYPAMAADYPSEPITYCIPFNPGGQSDLEARRQQPLLEKALGQKILIQYKPGGGGSVGWTDLMNQKPNGYYISGINVPHIILQPLARGNAGYETEKITPIAIFQTTPIGLAVLKDSPFKTLDDLIKYAKANPGAVVVGGSGTWSGHHIANLQLQDMAGIQMTYVPHKGAAPSVAAFLGGHVQAMWANSNDLVQHADKLRVLAFGTKKPFFAMPDVPTFESLGYKLYAAIDRGAGAPPDTPADRIKVLETAFKSIVDNPEVQAQMKRDGFVPVFMNSQETKDYIAEMTAQWAPVVKKFKK
ncbi:Bug family tripartite tricarboxylate transporter substrate binding protein [Desulfocurvus sp. DL9XJH121]